MDNEKITIGNYEVDMTLRSHPIHPDIIKAVRKVIKEQPTMTRAAALFGLHRNNMRVILSNKTCSPDTLVNFIQIAIQKQTA